MLTPIDTMKERHGIGRYVYGWTRRRRMEEVRSRRSRQGESEDQQEVERVDHGRKVDQQEERKDQ